MAENRAAKASDLTAFRGFSLDLTREKVDEALQHFGRLGIFSEYTKHDISHVDGMLEICDWLVPTHTVEIMTPADWLMIVLSTYFHDFGLLVTAEEYERRGQSGFYNYVEGLKAAQDDPSKDYLAKLEALDPEERERFHYQEFVRANHATRIKTWISGSPSAQLGFDQNLVNALNDLLANLHSSFVKDLGIVCESHHREDLNDVVKYKVRAPYGRTPEENANVQYAAILLRTMDLLHITEDRTPSIAALIINPANPVSQDEWAKQQAVRSVRSKVATNREGELDEDAGRNTVEIFATFTDERGYFGLTRYLRYAEDELRRSYSWALASRKHHGVRHEFPWRYIDTGNVEAEGFVARQFEFEIDQHKILELLTGHTLYNDTKVVLRELVQNSIDAVRLQQLTTESHYEPAIVIKFVHPYTEIVVMDNGTGMSQDIIEANFLKVGSSRYQDPAFKKMHPEFHPISRFGIGVLSAFMIADDVRVVTSHPDDSEARELTLESVHGDYLIRLLDKNSTEVPDHIRSHGTCVRLGIRPSAGLDDVESILRHWVLVPRCRVEYVTDRSTSIIGYENIGDVLEDSLARSEKSTVGQDGKPPKWKVNVHSEDGFEIAYATRWDEWNQEWLLGVTRTFDFSDEEEEKPDPSTEVVGICVEGIRVTNVSPGFQDESGVIAVMNATGPGSPRTNVARSDLERTPEYRSLLERVYEAYSRKVASELDELTNARGFSMSRAAREVRYLLGPLGDHGGSARVESRTLLDQAISGVPCFLLEDGDGRQLKSLDAIGELGEIATVQGPITRHLGYFLEQVQTDVTIKAILDLVGNSHVPMPDLPIIGGHEDSFYLSQLLRKKWEVASLETFTEPPFVVARWRRREVPSRWVRMDDEPRVSPGVAQAAKELSTVYRHSRRSFNILVPKESVDFKLGHDEAFAVELGRDILLAHRNPLLAIESRGASVTELDRLWLIGRIARLIYGVMPRSVLGGTYSMGATEKDRIASACSRFLSGFLDDGSLRDSIQLASAETLNVLAWDRRYTNANEQ
ncbi:ATP-binding protein [Solwaraspora sp. WMMA2059]|uniref:HD domain-containing protein n=1 Tax=Solwaraspora sp. WMMA2059 TaxID=3015160 RepID=UPI00248AA830|nr:ATP-binding protein [Solwaraspora sp. WMMA2059]WBB98011.1 ATP-binding protein [Solwaraspora sp. WMMA2059]